MRSYSLSTERQAVPGVVKFGAVFEVGESFFDFLFSFLVVLVYFVLREAHLLPDLCCAAVCVHYLVLGQEFELVLEIFLGFYSFHSFLT